jgi:hypothetical protein
VGTTSPDRAVTIYRSGGIGARLNFQTNDTGTGDGNGTEMGVYQNNMNAFIWNYENSDIYFGTNNAERMRITSGGAVGIHTTSPNVGSWTDKRGVLTISSADEADANNYAILEMQGHSFNSSGINGLLMFLDHTVEEARIQSNSVGSSQGDLRFYTNAGSGIVERMRITSGGNALFNCTSFPSASVSGFGITGTSSGNASSSGSSTSAWNHLMFYNGNGNVGYISTSSSATTYSTSSDYRLKENEVLISDGLTRLNQLKPYRFNFKADKDTTVDGFFAHEVAEVVPEAITGKKDAVDDDGNIVSQGIDQSKLVPLLVKALQELSNKNDALETRIVELENA